ncbi:MAG TPA: COX15/CtaA family protein [Thermoplasmata archaeon]|nr:COX15/CtaA family protein [Thermoplasmata archaeon]
MDGHRIFRLLTLVAFLATYVTMLLGGNVMASDSGLACPDWPTCHGSLSVPWSGSVGIEWSHRVSALVLSVLIVALALVGLFAEARRPVLRNLALGALGLVVAQALLGGLVVRSDLSVPIVLAHFTLATLLFALLLVLAALAHLKEVPKRWIDWARAASTESAPAEVGGAPAREIDRLPAIARAAPSPWDR